ncbi:hypothetical protein SDC9_51382 [bioreactor metagenome]|uniref:Uncharacterized protein n=1 Tax=bioreactor metagenome TaxID=1076179 RepID=A0A644WNQ0_9ZZZZ
MGNRNHQLNVTNAFATDFLFSHLNTTTIADNTFITDTFVFSAMTFKIFGRTKNTFAEQTVTFRLISPVVDGFRFEYLTA